MVRQVWRRLLDLSPETLFLIFATFGGLVLVALIPPVAGGNEQFNFQRVANIAAFHLLIEPAQVPLGTKRLLDMAHGQFNPGQLPPYHYSTAQFDAIASIPLDARTPATLDPNPIAVLNPVAYIPQVGAYWLGEAFGWSPLVLFYLGRLAGLAAAIGLTFSAIRRMPFHRYGLCAVALLPTLAFSRSTLDADQVTNGLAFLFVAHVLGVASSDQPIRWRTMLWLAAIAFLIAQCKTAYLVLPALAFAIPVDLYGSARRYLLASLAIAVPGALVSIGWMLSLQHGYFAGIHYFVRGAAIYPDGQVAAILADPLNYAQVVARTTGGDLSAADFERLGRYEVYLQLVANGQVTRYASGRTLPLPPPLSDPARVREASRLRYGRPISEVEAELAALLAGDGNDLGPVGRRRREQQ